MYVWVDGECGEERVAHVERNEVVERKATTCLTYPPINVNQSTCTPKGVSLSLCVFRAPRPTTVSRTSGINRYQRIQSKRGERKKREQKRRVFAPHLRLPRLSLSLSPFLSKEVR